MRILLHGINYSPELTGIGKYSGEMGAWLAGRGHDVRVVTAPPYYPAWRVGSGYRGWIYRTEPGSSSVPVRVYRCPVYVPRRPSGATRILHLGSFMLSSFPIMLGQAQWRPDVVMAVEPSLLSAFSALTTARMAHSLSWLHVQDFEVDAAFDLGLLTADGRMHRFAEGLERQTMKRFNVVSTISDNMVQRLSQKGVPSEKTVRFPNWVDTEEIAPMQHPSRLRTELGLGPDRVVLLYSGNMGMKQGLDILPVLARQCAADPRIHFIFCGDGAYRPQLASQLHGVANVTMLPLQPLDRLNDMLNAADVHLLPQRSDAADLVMPSKLTGMLASGRPVITTAAPGTQVATAVHSRGTVVAPDDMPAFVAAVESLADNPGLRQTMGANARRYAVEFLGKERVLARFEEEMQRALSRHRALSRKRDGRLAHGTVGSSRGSL